jgi:hypothetical protein
MQPTSDVNQPVVKEVLSWLDLTLGPSAVDSPAATASGADFLADDTSGLPFTFNARARRITGRRTAPREARRHRAS